MPPKSPGLLAWLLVAGGLLLASSVLWAAPPAPTKDHPTQVTRTAGGQVDMCLGCHDEKPDKAHGREVLGCAVCHKGDPMAGNKFQAHRGMIKNPGDLRWAASTCGTSGCHPHEVEWVKNTLMATNRGIITTLRYYWGESPTLYEDISVKLLMDTGMNSPALDYFRKLCGSCHLWMEKGSLPYFLADKGGGCSACHFTPNPEAPDPKKAHPWIVRKIPMDNCIRCHNRSGRIGLSYQGQFESEQYGTPLQDGTFTDDVLPDGRFYDKLPDDVHHKAGLICIDCHSQKETMGNGIRHAHLQEQVEIKCATCHGDDKALSAMAGFAAKYPVPTFESANATFPYPKLNVKKAKDGFALVGMKDDRPHPLDPPDPVACRHDSHRRLSCQACHSTWVPQCYGCHVQMDGSKDQLDKIAIKDTPGRWKEFRSFIRYACPSLGVLEPNAASGNATGEAEMVILVPG